MMDRQFVTFINDFHNKIANNDNFEQLKFDEDEIIRYVQSIDSSFKRKPQRNLRVSCTAAIKYVKELLEESDLSEADGDVNGSMNSALLDIYAKNGAHNKETNEEEVELKVSKRKKVLADKEKCKKPKVVDFHSKWPSPTVKLSDLGGIDEVGQELLQLIGMPLQHPEIFRHLGIEPARGILLHGPPGCGKTLIANAIAGVI